MGLIKAITGATDGVLADQWRDDAGCPGDEGAKTPQFTRPQLEHQRRGQHHLEWFRDCGQCGTVHDDRGVGQGR